MKGPVVTLVGGVGGSKLAWGLAQVLPKGKLRLIVNTGDDEEFFGLHVSPDLDTVMYTLSGLVNPEAGWGLGGDSYQALEMLGRYGQDTWFHLGDKDLATHIYRTYRLRQGATLSQVTQELCQHLKIQHEVAPMSDDPIRTTVVTDEGELSLQVYFVQKRCEPKAKGIKYIGAEAANASPTFDEALKRGTALVFAPSNPFLSIEPILSLPEVRKRIASFSGPRLAVSPIVGGEAIRGPAAKMLRELGEESSCVAVARRYIGLCDIFVMDERDRHLAPDIQGLGFQVAVAPTVMVTPQDKIALAERVIALIGLKA